MCAISLDAIYLINNYFWLMENIEIFQWFFVYYLRQFLELAVLLLGVSVFAEILFGPDVAFFGSQVTKNLVALLNTLGDSGIAALIVILALMIVYRRLLK